MIAGRGEGKGVGSVAAVAATLIVLLTVRTERQWPALGFLDRTVLTSMWIAAIFVMLAVSMTCWRYLRSRTLNRR